MSRIFGGMEKPLLAERQIGIGKAAWMLEDAMSCRLVLQYPTDPEARQLYFRMAGAEHQFSKALLLMIVAVALETPAWCDAQGSLFAYVEPGTRCNIPGAPPSEVLLSNLPYIPHGWAMIIELAIMLIVGKKLLRERQLQLQYFDPLGVTYNSKRIVSFGLAMIALEVLDCFIFVVFRPGFRLAFISRTGYLLLLPQVQKLLLCVLAVVGEFVSIAIFYAGTIVFFAWVAVVMFDDMEGKVIGVPVNKGFETFTNSLNTMFVAGSTDDFVDVLLPTYSANRAIGILWFVFLVIVHVLLLNLVLDTLVAAYTRFQEEKEEEESEGMVKGIRESFRAIQKATDATTEMTKEVFLEFTQELSRSPALRPISRQNADVIFQALDKDNTGDVDQNEFLSLCGVIQYDFWTTPEDSPVKRVFPRLWNSRCFQWFRAWTDNGGLDGLVDQILMINFLFMMAETLYDANGWDEPAIMANFEMAFSLVYVVEVAMKVSVWHFSSYWSSRSNQFDFTVTWMLLASSVSDVMVENSENSNLKRYINLLRLLRLIRVVKQLKRLEKVQKMLETIACLVAASKNIMMLLGVVMFFFTTLSVQLWGGIIYKSNPRLEETEYAEKGLWVLNFNDFGTAFGSWVVIILREYMDAFSVAISKASSIPGSWTVFLLFYIFGVSIVFELVKAFTIEAFLELHKKWGHGEAKELHCLEKVRSDFREQGLKFHCRVGDRRMEEKIAEVLEHERHGHHGDGAHGHGEHGGHGGQAEAQGHHGHG